MVAGSPLIPAPPAFTEVEATEYILPQDRKDLYVSNRPFNRVQMPDDVTGAVMFLMSDAASLLSLVNVFQ